MQPPKVSLTNPHKSPQKFTLVIQRYAGQRQAQGEQLYWQVFYNQFVLTWLTQDKETLRAKGMDRQRVMEKEPKSQVNLPNPQKSPKTSLTFTDTTQSSYNISTHKHSQDAQISKN